MRLEELEAACRLLGVPLFDDDAEHVLRLLDPSPEGGPSASRHTPIAEMPPVFTPEWS